MSGTGIVKRSLAVAGHRTSVSLEEPFWAQLVAMAGRRGLSVPALVAAIDGARGADNLSSALRLAVLADALDRAALRSPPATPGG